MQLSVAERGKETHDMVPIARIHLEDETRAMQKVLAWSTYGAACAIACKRMDDGDHDVSSKSRNRWTRGTVEIAHKYTMFLVPQLAYRIISRILELPLRRRLLSWRPLLAWPHLLVASPSWSDSWGIWGAWMLSYRRWSNMRDCRKQSTVKRRTTWHSLAICADLDK